MARRKSSHTRGDNPVQHRQERSMESRARAVQKRAKRRRRGRMIRRMIFIVLLVIAIVMAPTVFFRVSNIEVLGETRYTSKQLVATSGVHEGDNMFFLDTRHIISKLEAQYPYLTNVKLHRKMPSTLQIEVTDRVPILSLEQNGNYLYMDAEGKVLEKASAKARKSTEVIGASVDKLKPGDEAGKKQERIMVVLNLMELMTEYHMDKAITQIDIRKAYDVRITYKDQYVILLGSMDEEKLEHKIQFLQAILKQPSLPETGVIDLSGDSEARYRPLESNTSGKSVVFEERSHAGDIEAESEEPQQTEEQQTQQAGQEAAPQEGEASQPSEGDQTEQTGGQPETTAEQDVSEPVTSNGQDTDAGT